VNASGCIVEVEFKVGGKKVKVVRGIKPNVFEIYIGGKMYNQDANARDYQKYLEQQILKLNYRSFTQVVILGNASFVPFMQLRSRHRRNVVEEILDIEIFSKMNFMFREKQKLQDETIRQVDFDYQLLDGKIDTQQKHIDEISNKNKDTTDTKKLEITKSDTDIENYQEDINRVRRDITNLQTEILDQTKVKNKHGKLTNMEAKLENTVSNTKQKL
jgi:DNA repair exonuclease SbcCD ATPase subunit